MELKPSEILRNAKELISDEESWCQGAFSRDFNGYEVRVHDPVACQWCGYGAVRRIMRDGLNHPEITDFLDHVVPEKFPIYNDYHTHAEVLAMFDKAIALAEAEEQ